jgi:hypothetical protein
MASRPSLFCHSSGRVSNLPVFGPLRDEICVTNQCVAYEHWFIVKI